MRQPPPAADATLLDVRPASPSRFRMIVAVVGSPIAWTLHLMGSYILVTVWCSLGWGGLSLAIGVVTVACAALAIWSGAVALGLRREGQAMLERDREPGTASGWEARMGERGARISFLAVMSIGSALLFTFLILLQGLPPLFTPPCWAGITG